MCVCMCCSQNIHAVKWTMSWMWILSSYKCTLDKERSARDSFALEDYKNTRVHIHTCLVAAVVTRRVHTRYLCDAPVSSRYSHDYNNNNSSSNHCVYEPGKNRSAQSIIIINMGEKWEDKPNTKKNTHRLARVRTLNKIYSVAAFVTLKHWTLVQRPLLCAHLYLYFVRQCFFLVVLDAVLCPCSVCQMSLWNTHSHLPINLLKQPILNYDNFAVHQC